MGGAAGRVRHCHSGTEAARQGRAAYPTNVVTGKRFREDSLDESGWDATNSRSRLTISRTVKKLRTELGQVKQAPSETSKSGRICSECKWSSDKRGGNGRRFHDQVKLVASHVAVTAQVKVSARLPGARASLGMSPTGTTPGPIMGECRGADGCMMCTPRCARRLRCLDPSL